MPNHYTCLRPARPVLVPKALRAQYAENLLPLRTAQVVHGAMDLSEAQRQIATDWAQFLDAG
jgi:hypothetical protein